MRKVSIFINNNKPEVRAGFMRLVNLLYDGKIYARIEPGNRFFISIRDLPEKVAGVIDKFDSYGLDIIVSDM